MYLTLNPKIDKVRQSARDKIWEMKDPPFSMQKCSFLSGRYIYPAKINWKMIITPIYTHEEWQDLSYIH